MANTAIPTYDPQAIEPRWRAAWQKAGLFRVTEDPAKPKFFNLVMFPYPSGPLHMGHFRNYVFGDAFARYKVMRGFNVLNPFGWDAFGLPAENAAIQSGIPPRISTEQNIEISKGELNIMGVMYAWDREVTTCNPDYYRWNQWLFLKFLERGLAYKTLAPVNWCPKAITAPAQRAAVVAYLEKTRTETEVERLSTEHEKTGVFTGAYARNPFTNEQVPIWVADYVLATYGTGAIMGVPGNDARDFHFATQ